MALAPQRLTLFRPLGRPPRGLSPKTSPEASSGLSATLVVFEVPHRIVRPGGWLLLELRKYCLKSQELESRLFRNPFPEVVSFGAESLCVRGLGAKAYSLKRTVPTPGPAAWTPKPKSIKIETLNPKPPKSAKLHLIP